MCGVNNLHMGVFRKKSVCLSVCLCVAHVQQGFSSSGPQNRMGLGPFVVAWFTVGHCRR